MDNTKVMPGTSAGGGGGGGGGGGPSAISVVVTTVKTPTSITASESTASCDTARRRVSPIKLVGVGGLERQNYCCGHWFPSSKSYHRHLAEKALVDLTHEMRLIELGMLRCSHCSIWVHVDSMNGHLRKSHGIIKVNKTSSKFINSGVNEISGINRDTLKSGTNFVIKVSGKSAVKSSNGDISCSNASSIANSSTVRLVTTSSGSLYHKVHQLQHSGASGMSNVIVQKSLQSQLPMITRGPRIVMKPLERRNVIPVSSSSKVLTLPECSQTIPPPTPPPATTTTTTTAARNVNGITTVQISGGSIVPSSSTSNNKLQTSIVKPQENILNVNGQSFKLIKKIATVKSKIKTSDSQPAVTRPTNELPVSTKARDKGKTSSIGETLALKSSQVRKSRKQVLKPSVSDVTYTSEASSLSINGKMKKRGKKNSDEPELLNAEKSRSESSINHRGCRRRVKETVDSENYTPKITRQTSKGLKGGWKKRKRGPGRPRKVHLDETPDLSELESLFDDGNKEDLENEPILMTKEEDNVPTVELDLFTLPSLNEQVSVLLTEPQNPNFKVYASMDAIFVGDSALGDVTNQIGYVTDANNVVYVNPGHFLFPNVEDLENFIPSPILTMKGNKVGFTPVRQIWKLNSSKVSTPVVLRDNKFLSSSTSKESSSCDVNNEKVNIEGKESQVPVANVSVKQMGNEKLLKNNAEVSHTENILHVKPTREASQDVGNTKSNNLKDTSVDETLFPGGEESAAKTTKSANSRKRSSSRRQSNNQSDDKEEDKDILNANERILVKSSMDGISVSEPENIESISTGSNMRMQSIKQLNDEEDNTLNADEIISTKSSKDDTREESAIEAAVSASTYEGSSITKQNNNQMSDEKEDILNAKERIPVISSKDDVSLTCRSLDGSDKDTVDIHQTEMQSNLIVNQEVQLEDQKSPVELRETSVLESDTRILKSPTISDIEQLTTKKEEVDVPDLATSSKLILGSSLESEQSTCSLAPEPGTALIDAQEEMAEDSGSPSKSDTKPLNSPRNSVSRDVSVSEMIDNTAEIALAQPLQPETKKVSCVKYGNLSRRRRRRSRTKSADIVSRFTYANQNDVETGGNEGHVIYQPRRKTRQLSESSAVLKETRHKEGEKVKISDLTFRLTVEDLPRRLNPWSENVGKVESDSCVEQMPYPLTPSNVKTLPSSTEFKKIQSSSLEKVSKCSLKRIDNREAPVSNHNESDNKTPVRISRQRRRSSKLLESLGIEPLKTEHNTAIIEGIPAVDDVNNTSVKERLSDVSNVEETRTVRERRPSSKLLDSVAVTSRSAKRNCSPNSTEKMPCAGLVDQPSLSREKPVGNDTENDCISQTDTLLYAAEKKRSLCTENKTAKISITEQVSPVPPVRESDLSPSREWHGRGAKLKAQVLIQDQQAGVTDSQIIPPNTDTATHSKDTPVARTGNEPLSPRIVRSADNEAQDACCSPQSQHTNIASSPTSLKVSKSPSSPTSLKVSKSPSSPTSSKVSKSPSSPTSSKVIKSPSSPTNPEVSKSPSSPTSSKVSKSPSSPTSSKVSKSPSSPTSSKVIKSPSSPTNPEVSKSPSSPISPEVSKSPSSPTNPEVSKSPSSPTSSKVIKSPSSPTNPEVSKSPSSPTSSKVIKSPSSPTNHEVSKSPSSPTSPEISKSPSSPSSPEISKSPSSPISPEVTKSPSSSSLKASISPSSATSPKASKSPSSLTSPKVSKSPSSLTNPKASKSPSSPTSPKASKSPKSLQDREWQARGAKLKAQIMISDQQSSIGEYEENITSEAPCSFASPPTKKIKLDKSPGANRDIRSFFTVQKSPVSNSDENKCPLSSPVHSSTSTTAVNIKKKTKSSNIKNDIRSFFSHLASAKRKSSSPHKPCTKVLKTEEPSASKSHKKSPPKKQDVHAVHLLRKEYELLESRVQQLAVSSLPVTSCNFEGFDRCSRQSGLRAKSLMRLVSLLSMKRWYHLGRFPLPVDHLCEWDDEWLSYLIFDSK